MDHHKRLETRLEVEPHNKLQWIPLVGIILSRTLPKEQSICAHARYNSEFVDMWALYQIVTSLGTLGGLYYLGDKYLW
ncbi:MAG: hypothetical protein AABX72_00735 [Nanoarchaeota archaeon]